MTRKHETVVGRIPVLEALRAGKRPARKLFLLRGGQGLEEIRAAAGAVPVEELPRPELDRLTEAAQHQGAVLWADPLPVQELREWLARAKDGPVVVLDEVEDPQNFGAIIRSAAALGAGAVLFGKDRAAPLSAAAVKAAAGAAEHVDLVQVTNIARALEQLKDAGHWITGLDAAGDRLLWELDFRGRIALVVGSEGKGMRRLVREKCDYLARIPLAGPITSLNASVSAAIALAECARQRASSRALGENAAPG